MNFFENFRFFTFVDLCSIFTDIRSYIGQARALCYNYALVHLRLMPNKKIQICKIKKLDQPALGEGEMDTVAGTALDMFVHHGLPWMGKKAVEMERYYGSEALRNLKLLKKAIDYALDKLNPMIQNVGSQALDQLSTKIRPKKNYKTNRKDLDGGAIDIHKATGKLPRPKCCLDLTRASVYRSV